MLGSYWRNACASWEWNEPYVQGVTPDEPRAFSDAAPRVTVPWRLAHHAEDAHSSESSKRKVVATMEDTLGFGRSGRQRIAALPNAVADALAGDADGLPPVTAQALDILRERLQSEQDRDLRVAAATALGVAGSRDQATVTVLYGRLQAPDEDAWVKLAAVRALVQLGEATTKSIAAGEGLLRHADAEVRRAAVRMLGDLGADHPEVVPPLLACVEQESEAPAVRASAAAALGQLKQAQAVPALSELAAVADATVRLAAVRALGLIGGPVVLPTLRGVLNTDQDPAVRAAAVDALGAIGSRSAVPSLAATLREDASSKVRSAAADALAVVGGPSAPPALVASLSDEDPDARFAVVQALGLVGTPAAIPALLSRKRIEQDPDVRHAIAEALEMLEADAALGKVIVLSPRKLPKRAAGTPWQVGGETEDGTLQATVSVADDGTATLGVASLALPAGTKVIITMSDRGGAEEASVEEVVAERSLVMSGTERTSTELELTPDLKRMLESRYLKVRASWPSPK